MSLPFLDRAEERRRLDRFLKGPKGGLAVLYGRRRMGKSRLLLEVLPKAGAVYYAADLRDAHLQRSALAAEIARVVPGFDRPSWPDFDALFSALWEQAPAGFALAIDEFPFLVSSAPEIPGLLQKRLDAPNGRVRLLLCGSSQRMMQGLVLDRTAPLYGRAREILRVGPLPAGFAGVALGISPEKAVEAFAVFGGVPRYLELASEFRSLEEAVADLVLDPLGVLHGEPERLLLDDLRETAQAASILSCIGQGCHRLSEIAARLGKPATSLSRPIQRLAEMDLVRRIRPFGAPEKDAKRSIYRIADPFLRFSFTFVAPNRSRLEARQVTSVWKETALRLPAFVSSAWEDLARDSVSRLPLCGIEWKPASSWWGPGLSRIPMEIDVVAESADRKSLLLGEAKWEEKTDFRRAADELARKAADFPLAKGRNVRFALFSKRPGKVPGLVVASASDVIRTMR